MGECRKKLLKRWHSAFSMTYRGANDKCRMPNYAYIPRIRVTVATRLIATM
jgi:hypothetical protein